MRKQLLSVAVLALTFAAFGACKAREESAPPTAQAAAPAAVAPTEAAVPVVEPPQTVAPVAEPKSAAPAPATTAQSLEKPKSATTSPKTVPAVPPAAVPAPPAAAAPPTAVPASKPSPVPAAPVAPAPKAASVVDPGGDVAVAATKPGLTRIGAEKCKLCHKVQHVSWAASAHAKRTPPLECESCHGLGSEYKVIGVMKDPAKAKQAGLVVPNADFCGRCHEGPVDAAFLAKVHAHKAAS